MQERIAILLVEDDPQQAEVTGEILRFSDPRLEVTWAPTYRKGLDSLLNGRFQDRKSVV